MEPEGVVQWHREAGGGRRIPAGGQLHSTQRAWGWHSGMYCAHPRVLQDSAAWRVCSVGAARSAVNTGSTRGKRTHTGPPPDINALLHNSQPASNPSRPARSESPSSEATTSVATAAPRAVPLTHFPSLACIPVPVRRGHAVGYTRLLIVHRYVARFLTAIYTRRGLAGGLPVA